MKKSIIITFLFIPLLYPQSGNTVNNNENRNHPASHNLTVVIDSDINLDEALSGISIPENLRNELILLEVLYYGFDGKVHKGQMVANKSVAMDLVKIFNFIYETKFPVEKVIPMSQYNWSDEKSMQDNNTSCFNYRFVSGSRILSKHAEGLAVDINPKLNPYIKNGESMPEGAKYDPAVEGTLTSDSPLTQEFIRLGWSWGGNWKSLKDYQHFQKDSEK